MGVPLPFTHTGGSGKLPNSSTALLAMQEKYELIFLKYSDERKILRLLSFLFLLNEMGVLNLKIIPQIIGFLGETRCSQVSIPGTDKLWLSSCWVNFDGMGGR